MENKIEDTSNTISDTAATVSTTLITVLDRLAGKKSNVTLSFEDLTLEVGMMKAKLNGAIVLSVAYASEAKT